MFLGAVSRRRSKVVYRLPPHNCLLDVVFFFFFIHLPGFIFKFGRTDVHAPATAGVYEIRKVVNFPVFFVCVFRSVSLTRRPLKASLVDRRRTGQKEARSDGRRARLADAFDTRCKLLITMRHLHISSFRTRLTLHLREESRIGVVLSVVGA